MFSCYRHQIAGFGGSCPDCQAEINAFHRTMIDATVKETAMQTPTQEQLKDPEWWDENAPLAATHFCSEQPGEAAAWMRPSDDDYALWDCQMLDLKEWIPDPSATKQEHLFIPRPAKPESQDACPECGGEPDNGYDRAWPDPQPYVCSKCEKGESQEWVDGLPPVGCECEYQPDPAHKNIWHKCTFLAHMDGEFFVLRSEDSSVDRMNDSFPASRRFRPLKTDAERQREEVIAEAKSYLGNLQNNGAICNVIEKLYDAGMLRKGGE